MKLYIMTDMEGVCGVVDHDNWVTPNGRYYDDGKRLLTSEVNAAIEGFFEAGAEDILVVDGHGYGGIDHLHLDKRTRYLRMFPGMFPFLLDDSYDGIAWVGQHAKAGTEYAHIPHTGWFNVLDRSINGISVGEFGEMSYCAAEAGVPSIFASGDAAFVKEAEALAEGIVCVCVKQGTTQGTGDECTTEDYKERNLSAVHLHPAIACEKIRENAYKAAKLLAESRDSFILPDIKSPYEMITRYRASGDGPAYANRSVGNTIPELLNSHGELYTG